MRISVFSDLRFTATPYATGVGKHIEQMVTGLSRIEAVKIDALVTCDQLDVSGNIPVANRLRMLKARRLPLSWKFADAMWTITGGPAADRWCGDSDWVYCPKNDFIPIRSRPVAVTVHGAPELDAASGMSAGMRQVLNRWRRRTAYRRMLDQAAIVLTVSEFLKAQMSEWFGVSLEKIRVVGNGVEDVYFEAHAAGAGVASAEHEAPFVLVVGGLNRLDGGDRVVELADLLAKSNRRCRVLVAGLQHDGALLGCARRHGNIELLGYLPARQLAQYMRGALALYYATRYETFGIAALEAMAVGLPVVTSRVAAVPEILADAAIYVDVSKPECALEAIEAVTNDSQLRAEMIQRGLARSRSFRWSSCVTRLHEALLG